MLSDSLACETWNNKTTHIICSMEVFEINLISGGKANYCTTALLNFILWYNCRCLLHETVYFSFFQNYNLWFIKRLHWVKVKIILINIFLTRNAHNINEKLLMLAIFYFISRISFDFLKWNSNMQLLQKLLRKF